MEPAQLAAATEHLTQQGWPVRGQRGGGEHTATFEFDDAHVLKITDGPSTCLVGACGPRSQTQAKLGLLDVSLVERLVPGDESGLELRTEEGDRLDRLTPLQTESLLSLFFALPRDHGRAHFDAHLGNLGFTADDRVVFMDLGACVAREKMTDQDCLWCTAMQLGLLLENMLDPRMVQTDLFQEFAHIVIDNRRRPHQGSVRTLADLPKPRGNDWAQRMAVARAGARNPHLDIYQAVFLLSSYLGRPQNADRQRAENMVLQIQQRAVGM